MEGQHGDPHILLGGANANNTTYYKSKHENSKIHYGDKAQYITHNDYGANNRSGSSKRPQDLLAEHVSHGALHNSAQRGYDAPKCFPETRVAVQQDMIGWMKHGRCRNTGDGNTPAAAAVLQQILWLSGPAGAGKTAIMGTIADECYREGLLAASFFFSSQANSPDRCSKSLFVTTLVYQFIQHSSIVGLRDEVLAALDRDPLILKKNLEAQVDELLLQPLQTVAGRSDPHSWPPLVLLDGLDECRGVSTADGAVTTGDSPASKGDTHREILSVLVHACNSHSFPFRVIVASRPERAIESYLKSLPHGSMKAIFLDNQYSPEADIELYARAMLDKIGRDYGLSEGWCNEMVPADWPEDHKDIPCYLAEESSGQFVYVATVMRFVQGNSSAPRTQLKRVLNWRSTDASNPFAALDALYAGIMHTSPMPFQAALIVRAQPRLMLPRNIPPWFVQAILESSAGEMRHVLGPLSSLVRITGVRGEPDFHLHHKSLGDFLGDPERSGELHVGVEQVDGFISGRFYAILKNRGPQASVLDGHTIGNFLLWFCYEFLRRFPLARKYKYTTEDVDWWLANLDADGQIAFAYHQVHENCRWHTCQPTCKVWRKSILRYAKANGWCVPTLLEKLQDRFKPFPYVTPDSRGVRIRDILHPPRG